MLHILYIYIDFFYIDEYYYTMSVSSSGIIYAKTLVTSSISSENEITISSGTGNVQIGSFSWPSAAPTDGQVMKTDGNGNLVFEDSNSRVEVSSATYTISPSDDIIAITVEQDVTLTLPDPSQVTVGDILYIVKEVPGLNSITIVPNSTELISGQSSYSSSVEYSVVKMYSNGSNYFILY